MGQVDPTFSYFARMLGGAVSFAPNHAAIVIASPHKPASQLWAEPKPGIDLAPPIRLNLSWPGANLHPVLDAAEQLPGYVNYLRGNDARHWQTYIPTFATLTYHDLYPGINLRYDTNSNGLKGSYLVAPGADPSLIRWRYDGAARPTIDQDGNLTLAQSSAGSLDEAVQPLVREQAPVAWQQAPAGTTPVEVSFAVHEDGSVGFEVGRYDPTQPLLLDPYMLFGTPLSSYEAAGYSIAVDGSGAIYVTGAVNNDYLPLVDPLQQQRAGRFDAFVIKLNPAGTQIVYSTYLGGQFYDYGYGIALDSAGQAYISGTTDSDDFPTTTTAFQPAPADIKSCFVSALSASGAELVYSTYFGGLGWDACYSIALNAERQATVVGLSSSIDFPARHNLFASGDGRGFVARFSSGGELDFATIIPGSVGAYDVALDGQGNAYVAGESDHDTLPRLHALEAHYRGGASDGFALALSADGSSLRYATYLGGAAADRATGIAVSTDGAATVVGKTESSDFLDGLGAQLQTQPFQPELAGGFDGFAVQLAADGSSLQYGTYLGTPDGDLANEVALDSSGAAYVIGSTESAHYPVSHAVQWRFGGYTDAVLTKLNPAGSAVEYSTYLGGSGADLGFAVAVGASGNAYISGINAGIAFPRAIRGSGSDNGAFVAVIGEDCMLRFADVPEGSPFYFYIENLACRGVASGYGDGTYRVGASLTRAQLAKIVAGAAGLDDEILETQQTFADVPPADPFWLPIERAVAAGIIAGYSCDSSPQLPCDEQQRPYYRPAISVTRGQTAKIVARGVGWSEDIAPHQQSFADVAPGDTFWLEIERAHAHGALAGYDCSNGTAEACDAERRPYYRPVGTVTRGQAAKIVDSSFFPDGETPAPAPSKAAYPSMYPNQIIPQRSLTK